MATCGTAIACICVAVVTLICTINDAIAAREHTHARSAAADVSRLDDAKRRAPVAGGHIAVVARFGASDHAIATIERADARCSGTSPALFEAAIVGATVIADRIAIVARFRTLLDSIAAQGIDSNEDLVGRNGGIVAVFLDLNVIRAGRQVHRCGIRCRINQRTGSYAAVVIGGENGRAIGSAELKNRVCSSRTNVVIRGKRLHLDICVRWNRKGEQVFVGSWCNGTADEHGSRIRHRCLRAGIIRFDFRFGLNATIRRATIARDEIAVITRFRTLGDSIATKRVVFHFELIGGNRRRRVVMPHAHVIHARGHVFRRAVSSNRRVNLGAGARSTIVIAHEHCRAVRTAKFDDGIVTGQALSERWGPRLNPQVRMRWNGDFDVIFIRCWGNATIEDKRHSERTARRGTTAIGFEFQWVTNAWFAGTSVAWFGVTSVVAAVAIDGIAVVAFFESNELPVTADCRTGGWRSRAIESSFKGAARAASVAAEDVSVIAGFGQNRDAIAAHRRTGAGASCATITNFNGASSRTTIAVCRISVVTRFAGDHDVVVAIRCADRRHPHAARVSAFWRAHRTATVVAQRIAVIACLRARYETIATQRVDANIVYADVARAITVLATGLSKHACRTRSATAIDVGLCAVFHGVRTRCSLTNHAHAYAAVAIARDCASATIRTSRARSATTIDARLSSVFHRVRTHRRDAHTTHAHLAGAIRIHRANLGVGTWAACWTAAIDVRFIGVLDVVRAALETNRT